MSTMGITLFPFWFCNYLHEKEKAGCFAFLSSGCLVTVNVLWLFLTVPWVGLQCVILLFSDHTHLFFMFGTNWKIVDCVQDG